MGYIQHLSGSLAGPETHVTGVTDIVVSQTDTGLHIYTASGRGGGVIARDAGLAVRDTEAFRVTAGLGAEAELALVTLGGRDALLVSGPAQAGISGFWLGANGQITGRLDIAGPRVEAVTALETARLDGTDYFFTAARGAPGVTVWRQDAGGRLQEVDRVAAGLPGTANDIFAMEHLKTGGGDYLLTVSAGGQGVQSFRLDAGGHARLVDSIDMGEGLATTTATTLSRVTVGGQDFVLMGAAGTSSITVIAVGQDGSLRTTDQVNDDLNTRFQSISVLETIVVDGRAFVVAGGADDGLSLLTLLPDGRLLHLETLADDLRTALTNPAGVALAVTDGRIAMYSVGGADDSFGTSGVDRFEIDPDKGVSAGRVIQGGAGNDQLRGGAGADIVMDGAGSDRMWGGAGADIFVVSGDGVTDTIEDFEIGIDRIDMSQMGRFYSVSALKIDSRADGAALTINGETLVIKTADGARLRAEDFRNADVTDLWHVPGAALPQGNQEISGTAGSDVIFGAEGADRISGGSGGDILDGAAGDDIILGGAEDSVFDPAAATVFRLYQATLARAPDVAGHLSWTETLSQGRQSLKQVAEGFVNSAEFQRNYGEASDAEFVTLMYNNVLGRAPDAAGLRGWQDALAGGASRADVVIGFSESTEFKKDTAAGALRLSAEAYQAEWTDDVYRLYRASLDRNPDKAGLEGWTGQLAGGAAIADVAVGFTASREFRQTYGDLDDGGFVRQLYRNVLDREGEARGVADWTDVLTKGASRGAVVTGFSQSKEFTAQTARDVTDWVGAQGMDDVLNGGSGNNVLFGGMWADCFVFDANDGGRHTVVDLEAWDELMFQGFGYADADDVRAHLRQDGADVVFDDQGVEVRLIQTDMRMLSDDDIFGV